MRIFNIIRCFVNGHDVSTSKSIIETINSNNWIKQCNRCGRYIMHSDIGGVCISEKEAMKFKREYEQFANDLKEHIGGWRRG